MKSFMVICIYTVFMFSHKAIAQWRELNKGLNGGPVYSLYENNGVLFAGGGWRGLYVSKDTAAIWQSIGNGLPFVPVMQISVCKGNIIASLSSGHIYYSTDEGDKWNIADSLGTQISSFAVKGDTVFASTISKGVYVSFNRGITWELSDNVGLKNVNIRGLVLLHDKLFAATGADGIFVSSDFGKSWTQSGLGGVKLSSITVSGETLYSTANGEAFFSSDSGTSWLPINGVPVNITKIIQYYDGFLGISPNYIYYTPHLDSLWKTTFSSALFSQISCVAVGNRIILGVSDLNFSDWGIHLSRDAGKTWQKRNVGLSNITITSLVKRDNKRTYICTKENGVYKTENSGESWEHMDSFRNGYIQQILFHGDTIFLGSRNNGLHISYDDGATWRTVEYNFLNQGGVGTQVIYKVGNTIYFASNRYGDGLYSTTDFGKTWDVKKNGLIDNVFFNSIDARKDTIVAGSFNGVYVTTDHGDLWKLTENDVRKETPCVLLYKNTLWVVVDSLGVMRSTDLGKTWMPKNNGLANLGVHKILPCRNFLLGAAKMKTSYVNGEWTISGYGGVLASMDDGESWVNITSNFPVQNVEFIETDNENIYVGATGTGIYAAKIDELVLLSAKESSTSDNSLRIYPNPSNSIITVSVADNSHEERIHIYDMLGECVQEIKVLPSQSDVNIDISALSKGTYYIRTNSTYGSFVKY